jgi:TIR domain
MAYEYEIFLRYRRIDADWVRWTKSNFLRPLRSQLNLGGQCRLFFDEQIEHGGAWPEALGSALGRSLLFIPILSPSYFQSSWCRLEMATAYQRHTQLGGLTSSGPKFILPVTINDGDKFPADVQRLQQFRDFTAFANVDLCPDSHRQMEFTQKIGEWVNDTVRPALDRAPAWDQSFATSCETAFAESFVLQQARHAPLPTLAATSTRSS